MPQNQGFTKQSAYLRAADVKSIAKGGNRRQIQVIVLIAQAVAEACSVHIQIQPPPAANSGNFLKFLPGINGAQFGWLGNINHPGLRHMLTGLVIPVGMPRLLNLPGRQLPVRGRNGYNRESPEDYGKRELPENPFPPQSPLPLSFLHLPAYGYGNSRPGLILLHPRSIRAVNGQPNLLRNSGTPCTEKSEPTTNWMTTLAKRRNTNGKSRRRKVSASRRWMN